MNTEMVSSQGTSLDQAIKLSSTYFDDKSKTSKLLILISDGEDHSEGAQAAAEEANKQGMRINRFRNRKRRNYSFKEKWCRTKLSKRQ
jgi:Ca-activated chloride channel family protein